MPPAFTDNDFEKMRDLIYAKTGIRFDDSKRSYVEKRVVDRMQSLGSASLAQYAMKLRFDGTGSELQELINLMTVNETYFFREDYQLRCLTSSILPEIASQSGSRSLRIWSMPCSTGEEAYSIAIHLLEHFPEVDSYDIEIIGSDIDTKVLAAAERGVYQARSLQHVSEALRQRYFKRLDGESWQVSDELRGSISFTQTNVVERLQTLKCGLFDVVFCRNMLIYFDDLSRRKAIENIFEALRPGSFVCLGHSESMSRISALFNIRKYPDGIVYQKP